jgi:medium-chain acyl-[acyl-carrier-protein] hydrolase
VRFHPRPAARVRLFCFPHAGAGATAFFAWSKALPADVELCAVQLPGREKRRGERPYEDFDALVEAAVVGLGPELVGPFAFFGHSLGALLAFEIARALRRRHAPLPAHLFVSGRQAAHLPTYELPAPDLDDAAFLDLVGRRYGGIPAPILAEPELVALFLPAMRADFRVIGTYVHRAEAPLPLSLSAYGGIDDPLTPAEGLAAWSQHASGQFASQRFPGGHFYLQSQLDHVLKIVGEDLRRCGSSSA